MNGHDSPAGQAIEREGLEILETGTFSECPDCSQKKSVIEKRYA